MNVYHFAIYLNENNHIRREVYTLGRHDLKNLHHAIMQSFHIVRNSKVSMYYTTPKWRKKGKIALAKLPTDTETQTMDQFKIRDFFTKDQTQLLYECKTFRNWLFNVELIRVKHNKDVDERQYPDWEDRFGLGLNDYKKQLDINTFDELLDDNIIEDIFGEALKDFENRAEPDEKKEQD